MAKQTGAWVLAFFCGTLLWSTAATAIPQIDKQQRRDFLAAEHAFRKGNLGLYRAKLAGLKDYPLYPYLQFMDLETRLSTAQADEVEAFLDSVAGGPLEKSMRRRWLNALTKRREWPPYLRAYRDNLGTKYTCRYYEAQLQSGQEDAVKEAVASFWVKQRKLPKECNSVLAFWEKSGAINHDMAWRRVRHLMHERKPKLAKKVAPHLSARDQNWLKVWYELYHKPAGLNNRKLLPTDGSRSREIYVHVLGRLARRNPSLAGQQLTNPAAPFELTAAELNDVRRAIGLTHAYRKSRAALKWLGEVAPSHVNEQVQQWRIRAALTNRDWQAALHWIDQLPEEERDTTRWQYWRARALESSGQGKSARAVYLENADRRRYESFLAADRLGKPYKFENRPIEVVEPTVAKIEQLPGFQRVYELYRLGRIVLARREWYYAIRGLSKPELEQVAKMLHQWGWHDRAILTLSRTDHHDDLKMRFPLRYKKLVQKHSKEVDISPAWTLAMIRRESAFNRSARSPVGAMGLMQLMPRTARSVARALDTRIKGRGQLFEPEFNVYLGTNYLRMELDKFSNHPVLAIAAYNAGPHRVKRWLPRRGKIDPDIWVESIPFTETRDYVRNVLAYTAIYERRMGLKLTRLSKRMRPRLSRELISPEDEKPKKGKNAGQSSKKYSKDKSKNKAKGRPNDKTASATTQR